MKLNHLKREYMPVLFAQAAAALFVLSALLLGCGSGSVKSNDKNKCNTNEDCEAGYSCVSNVCSIVSKDGDIEKETAEGDKEEAVSENEETTDGSEADESDEQTENEGSIIVSPDAINFGAVIMGAVSDKDVTVENRGELDVTLISLELDGSTSKDYAILNGLDGQKVLKKSEKITFTVRYLPSDPGIDEGLLKVYFTGDPIKTSASVRLYSLYKGTPKLTVTPDALTFPSTQVTKTSQPSCLTLGNYPDDSDANKAVTITSIYLDSRQNSIFEGSSLPTYPLYIAPKKTVNVCFVFHPTVTGELKDTIVIENDDPSLSDGKFKTEISGKGVAPEAALDPDPVNFGRRTIGRVHTINIKIKNKGGADMLLKSVTLTENSTGVFALRNLPNIPSGGMTVASGAYIDADLDFNPLGAGSYGAKISIESDDPVKPKLVADVSAFAVASGILIEPSSTIAFGSVKVSESSEQSVSFKNAGDDSATFNGISFLQNSPFSERDSNAFPFTLAPGAVKQVWFKFNPQAEGSYNENATIEIDQASSGIDLTFLGDGVLPRIKTDLEGNEMAFGDVIVSKVKTIQLTITNSGGYPLKVTGVNLTNSASPFFTVLYNGGPVNPFTLNAGASKKLDATFAPTDIGGANGTLTIESDAVNDPVLNISLSGRGVNPTLAVDPELTNNEYAFGRVLINSSVGPFNLKLINAGTGDLVITNISVVHGSSPWITFSGLPTFESGQTTTLKPFAETGDAVSFTAQYSPMLEAEDRATLQIDSNAVNGQALLLFRGEGYSNAMTSIYVAENATGTGTKESPMGDLQSAVNLAQSGWTVYVSKGTYSGPIVLKNGVAVMGGYDAAASWSFNAANIVNINTSVSDSQGKRIGIRAHDITDPTLVQDVRVNVKDNFSPSGSNYGLHAQNAAGLTLKNVVFTIGRGGDGNDGANGQNSVQTGKDGTAGQQGCEDDHTLTCQTMGTTCDRPLVGIGGTLSGCLWGTQPGAGGSGGACGKDNHNGGQNGSPGIAGGPDGSGGAGGRAGICCDDPAENAGNGGDGANGAAGSNASGGAAFGQLSNGFYLPADGGSDATDGQGGFGGGGGGGGGGGSSYVWDCSSYGGAGGGGGSGGCGGQKGESGKGGGGAFGVMLVGTTITMINVTVNNGKGGDGGDGGTGGIGAAGGNGAGGGGKVSSSFDDSGTGGAGGKGGTGGKGGEGAGGGGGPSYCFYATNTSILPTGSDWLCSGVQGGRGGNSYGNKGADGMSGEKNW